MAEPTAVRHLIRVTGIVQGVGFRPFIYRLATDRGLSGFVLNDGEGVFIEAEGEIAILDEFIREIRAQAPKASRIDSVQVTPAPALGYRGFEIRASLRAEGEVSARVSPDLAVCSDCLAEIQDPAARRYRYPFTNCTLCGPRFTIIRSVPYDRPHTTMSGFPMCRRCREEYENPADRRFHAQPIACPDCGPDVALLTADGVRLPSSDPLGEARSVLAAGKILAVKGLGGYHLACDARNEVAVRTLRARKIREEKPFAVMAAGLEAVRVEAFVTPDEEALLLGAEAPIVLLRRRPESTLSRVLAPGQEHLGMFLPYTPLHHLLLNGPDSEDGPPREESPDLLVMTSGNRSDEPIAYRDEDALARLGEIADYFLVHNRPIHLRCDDSVVRIAAGRTQILRRSRGYVPRVTPLPWPVPAHTLAVGPHLKNTFALAKGFDCYLGPHVGDLENLETYRALTEGIEHLGRLLDITPAVVAHDLHPDYLSTGYAATCGLEERIGCQHHEAHIASVLGEHAVEEPAIGVALDGTGYGHDGTIWGGEFFLVRERVFTRQAHLAPLPMPGGDKAAREPWRAAAAYLKQALGPGSEKDTARVLQGIESQPMRLIHRMLEQGLNTPLSSGAGRAFDAASAVILKRLGAAYEGQGPMELEQAAVTAPETGEPLPFAVLRQATPWILDLGPAFAVLAAWALDGRQEPARMARRFHQTMASLVVETAGDLADREGVGAVCLSGGVFQNQLLLGMVEHGLEERGLRPLRNELVPPNDGGISYGQMVLASWRAFGGVGRESGGRATAARAAAARATAARATSTGRRGRS